MRRILGIAALLVAWAALAVAEPQRIVSLAPSATETVFALGLGDRLVGVSSYCDFPPEAARIDKVGTFLTPNIEAIVQRRPDIILAVPTPGNRGSVETLRGLGFAVTVVDPGSIAEIQQSIITIGEALGRAEDARRLALGVANDILATRRRLAKVAPRKVLMVVGQTPLIAAGAGTVQDEMIRLARGVNLGAEGGRGWPHLSLEFAITAAPEVIIDSTMGNEERTGSGAALAFWSAFPTIPAVRDRRVEGFHAYELLRPGPRIGRAFETIARFIHPEQFAAEATAP